MIIRCFGLRFAAKRRLSLLAYLFPCMERERVRMRMGRGDEGQQNGSIMPEDEILKLISLMIQHEHYENTTPYLPRTHTCTLINMVWNSFRSFQHVAFDVTANCKCFRFFFSYIYHHRLVPIDHYIDFCPTPRFFQGIKSGYSHTLYMLLSLVSGDTHTQNSK